MQVNDIQISQYLTLNDFESPDTKEVKLNPRLLILTEMMMLLLSPGLIITSGYRTLEHNKAIGGAENSYHMKGEAVDFKHSSLPLKLVARVAKRIGFHGVILEKEKNHVHCDIRSTTYYAGFTPEGEFNLVKM